MDSTVHRHWSAFVLVGLLLCMPLATVIPPADEAFTEEAIQAEHASARAQTTWSGTVTVTTSYTVAVFDELIVSACTQIELGAGARIYIDGRLTVEGTNACPVVMYSFASSDHEGLQFNSSSNGRGSIIDNLTIEDSIYGVTIYGSNPVFSNLTILNPDRVGVDLFSSAAPIIPRARRRTGGVSDAAGHGGGGSALVTAVKGLAAVERVLELSKETYPDEALDALEAFLTSGGAVGDPMRTLLAVADAKRHATEERVRDRADRIMDMLAS